MQYWQNSKGAFGLKKRVEKREFSDFTKPFPLDTLNLFRKHSNFNLGLFQKNWSGFCEKKLYLTVGYYSSRNLASFDLEKDVFRHLGSLEGHVIKPTDFYFTVHCLLKEESVEDVSKVLDDTCWYYGETKKSLIQIPNWLLCPLSKEDSNTFWEVTISWWWRM